MAQLVPPAFSRNIDIDYVFGSLVQFAKVRKRRGNKAAVLMIDLDTTKHTILVLVV